MPLLATILLPLFAAVSALLLGRTRILAIERITVLSMGVVLGLSLMNALTVAEGGLVSYGAWFALDAFSVLFLLVIAFVGTNVALYSSGYLEEEQTRGEIGTTRVWQYYVLLNLFLFAMVIGATTTSPVLTWVAIEATTLATAFLVSFYNKSGAIEAAWKYILINSVGLLLGFFGVILLIASATKGGPEIFLTWTTLKDIAVGIDPLAAKVAFIFIFIGFGTKIGLAPMHTWLPDAHSNAPTPISALLSGVLLNVALMAVLRFKGVVDVAAGPTFTNNMLIGFGLLSIAIVGFTLLIQRNYKRMLAYSSIENMGLIALGAGLGGVAAFGALLHVLYHSLTKSLLFLSSGNIFLKYHSTMTSDVRGVLRTLPKTGVFFFAGLFVLVGMPPFGMFASKFAIISGAAQHSYWLPAVLIVLLALVFIGFIKHGSAMLFGEPDPKISSGEFSLTTLLPLYVLLGTLVILSVYIPQPLVTLLSNATLLITGGMPH